MKGIKERGKEKKKQKETKRKIFTTELTFHQHKILMYLFFKFRATYSSRKERKKRKEKNKQTNKQKLEIKN